MITSKSALERELRHLDDNFITVIIEDKEYIIENIVHLKTHGDNDYTTHLALKVVPTEEGCLLMRR